MKKETPLSLARLVQKSGALVAAVSLLLLGACESKTAPDQPAEERDRHTDITEDADPDSTVESPATTGYVAPAGSPLVS
ncbi:hypothetical protein [Rufibacter immobilis]|nr:hypothetical protein [Rufibacter immobilis]